MNKTIALMMSTLILLACTTTPKGVTPGVNQTVRCEAIASDVRLAYGKWDTTPTSADDICDEALDQADTQNVFVGDDVQLFHVLKQCIRFERTKCFDFQSKQEVYTPYLWSNGHIHTDENGHNVGVRYEEVNNDRNFCDEFECFC